MFKKLNLKTKIIVSIIIPSFFLCIFVSIFLYFYLEKNLVDQKIENIYKLNIEQVHENIQMFNNNKTFAKMLGTRTRVKEYLLSPTEDRRKELSQIFNEYAKEDSKYLSLYLLDKNGVALISTDITFVGKNYSFRDYFKEGISGKPSMDILLGQTSKQVGYYYSEPVFGNNNKAIGVFVAKINGEEIDNSILDSKVSEDNGIMLVDKYGIVISSNKPERILKSLGKLDNSQKLSLKESGKFLDMNIESLQYDEVENLIREGKSVKGLKIKDILDGEVEIISINKIGEFPFYLVSETGLETTQETIISIILFLIGFILFGIFITFFILYRFILISLSPLKDLALISRSISKGDFSKRINVEADDDLGELAKAFNDMASDLDDLYKNLEKKVKERTEDFETSESVLKKTLAEAERVNKLMVGRELDMIKLKKEISELKVNNKNQCL